MRKIQNRRLWIFVICLFSAFLFAVSSFADVTTYVTGIFMKKTPDKVTYEIGEAVDLKGIEIGVTTQTPKGKKTKTITDTKELTWSPKKFSGAGTKAVTVSYKATGKSGKKEIFTTTFKVKVNEGGDAPAAWTDSIAITKKPKKTEYTVGEKFDKTGMVVTAYQLSGGKKEKVTVPDSYLTVSPTTLSKSGKVTVTVSAKLNDENGKTKTFQDTLTVTVYDKIKITKSPGAETVEEGGSCNFTAHANNYKTIEWYFEKGSSKVAATDAASVFKGLKISGTGAEKLKLSNIPLEMNGWKVYCVFKTPGESKTTKSCSLKVTAKKNSKATAAPTQAPTKAPQPTATAVPEDTAPAATAETAPTPLPVNQSGTPQPTEHAHSFPSAYKADEKEHWLECSCGERANVAKHIVTNWTTVRRATAKEDGLRTGVCAVCGHMVEETVPYEKSESGWNRTTALWTIGGIGAAVLVTVPPLLIAGMILRSKERKKKNNTHPEEKKDETAEEKKNETAEEIKDEAAEEKKNEAVEEEKEA